MVCSKVDNIFQLIRAWLISDTLHLAIIQQNVGLNPDRMYYQCTGRSCVKLTGYFGAFKLNDVSVQSCAETTLISIAQTVLREAVRAPIGTYYG